MSYYITHSGRKIYIENFTADDVCLKDIAHHLTKTCRFGGALPLGVHYSVAQHSIQLAAWARANSFLRKYPLGLQRALLMHDVSEAYLGDMIKPVKNILPDYTALEKKISSIIYDKYGILETCENFHPEVNHFDKCILLDEVKAFLPHRYHYFAEQLDGFYPLHIKPLIETNLNHTYRLFLRWCDKLGIKD